jgi:hypothetical protein
MDLRDRRLAHYHRLALSPELVQPVLKDREANARLGRDVSP